MHEFVFGWCLDKQYKKVRPGLLEYVDGRCVKFHYHGEGSGELYTIDGPIAEWQCARKPKDAIFLMRTIWEDARDEMVRARIRLHHMEVMAGLAR